MPEQAAEQKPSPVVESTICEVCGKFDALEIGDRKLCADCYQTSGSCCAEACDSDLEKD